MSLPIAGVLLDRGLKLNIIVSRLSSKNPAMGDASSELHHEQTDLRPSPRRSTSIGALPQARREPPCGIPVVETEDAMHGLKGTQLLVAAAVSLSVAIVALATLML